MNTVHIVDKLEKTPASFILSSYCNETIFDFVLDIASKLFSRHLKNTQNLLERLRNNLYPDFIRITPEGKEIKVEQLRELIPTLNHRPLETPYRIIVIQDAHFLNKSTANAILKILEEPPEGTSFFLLTNNVGKLLPTIISRCEILRIPAPKKTDLKNEFAMYNHEIFEKIFYLSGQNKERLRFLLDNHELILKLSKFIQNKTHSFSKIQALASELSLISQHNIKNQEYILFAMVKIVVENNYILAKKVLNIFNGIYTNTKDTLIFEAILMELTN